LCAAFFGYKLPKTAQGGRRETAVLKRDLEDCGQIIAGDTCLLREILHPDRAHKIRYSLARAVVRPGETTLLHFMRTSEVYHIIEGEGVMRVGEETAEVRPGATVYIPPRAPQCIRNTGKTDLVFVCIVDPAWRKKDEVILETRGAGRAADER
jgi:mannose-6-phosphate isomerase-like protein (cupin superfamily)